MKKFNYLLSIILCFMFTSPYSQVTYEENNPNINPVPLGYLGWNDNTNTPLTIRQNNFEKLRFTTENWNGINGTGNNDVSRISMPAINGELSNDPPFSILHLGYDVALDLERDWMHVGTTYSMGGDLLHLGLMRRPLAGESPAIVDAILAWGCNDDFFLPENGPDNLRFVFLTGTNQQSPGANTEQGRETMRITPMGNVGIGDFSTMPLGLNGTGFAYGQPRARLDVQYFGDRPEHTDDIALNVRNIATHETGAEFDKWGVLSFSDNFHEEALGNNYAVYGHSRGGRVPT